MEKLKNESRMENPLSFDGESIRHKEGKKIKMLIG